MDLKGSLVDTQLKIYPTESLLEFLKNLTEENDIPPNILKVIGRDTKITIDIIPANIQFTSKELENINKITEVVKDKFKAETKEDNHDSQKLDKNIETAITKEVEVEVDDKTLIKSDVKKPSPKAPFRTTSDLNWDDDEKAIEEKEKEQQSKVIEKCIPKPPFLTTLDIDWLYNHLQKRKNDNQVVPHLHELLVGANIEVPENKMIKRNPVLEARCVKLRKQQEAREYRKMTKTVDNVRLKFPEDSISYQMKQLNRQLIAIGQFIISIFAGFLFGFRGVEWMVGNLDFGFRLLLGVMCALVIALAEIYFLAKKLNEELNVPETVQLGGPPKFVDEANYMNTVPTKKALQKEHQD